MKGMAEGKNRLEGTAEEKNRWEMSEWRGGEGRGGEGRHMMAIQALVFIFKSLEILSISCPGERERNEEGGGWVGGGS